MKIQVLGNELNENESYIERVLRNRGITNVEEFFNLNWDCVNSPHNLEQLDAGLDMLEKHIKNNSKIAVLVD